MQICLMLFVFVVIRGMCCVLIPGPPPPELGTEEDGAAELEEVEEELEAVQVSETDFNFLDFIKR